VVDLLRRQFPHSARYQGLAVTVSSEGGEGTGVDLFRHHFPHRALGGFKVILRKAREHCLVSDRFYMG
jgi:hypothetical protein